MAKPCTGTYEWADVTRNLFLGCRNDCRYCYAREHALRFKRISSAHEWSCMRLNVNVERRPGTPNKPSTIMFPSTHDLFEDHFYLFVPRIRTWLRDGHRVLLVTKARLPVIKHLCDDLKIYRAQVIFRITIGSMDNDVLSFWEPGAPSYEERYDALEYAYAHGFATSVSCEPFLDGNIVALAKAVLPLVYETVWIGKMNNVARRVNTDGWTGKERAYLHRMLAGQHDDAILEIYEKLKTNPQIRWKDSIKRVIGIPLDITNEG